MTQQFTESRQSTGWTARKQRRFIECLAINGSVVDAAAAVGMTARSAYHLRSRPDGEDFRRGWDMALSQAGGHLVAEAFQRALHGGVRRIWKDGELVAEEVRPSDRVLLWLISRIGPAPFRKDAPPLTPPADVRLQRLLPLLRDIPPLPESGPSDQWANSPHSAEAMPLLPEGSAKSAKS